MEVTTSGQSLGQLALLAGKRRAHQHAARYSRASTRSVGSTMEFDSSGKCVAGC